MSRTFTRAAIAGIVLAAAIAPAHADPIITPIFLVAQAAGAYIASSITVGAIVGNIVSTAAAAGLTIIGAGTHSMPGAN